MFFNIKHGYLLKSSDELDERIDEYEDTILFKNTPADQLDDAKRLFRRYKILEKKRYTCLSCKKEVDGTMFDTRYDVCYKDTCHPLRAWAERPAELVYKNTYLCGGDSIINDQ